jgi:hypothetical protein
MPKSASIALIRGTHPILTQPKAARFELNISSNGICDQEPNAGFCILPVTSSSYIRSMTFSITVKVSGVLKARTGKSSASLLTSRWPPACRNVIIASLHVIKPYRSSAGVIIPSPFRSRAAVLAI